MSHIVVPSKYSPSNSLTINFHDRSIQKSIKSTTQKTNFAKIGSKHTFTSNKMSSYSNHQLPSYTSDPAGPDFPLAMKASYTSSWSKILCSSSKTIHLSPSPSYPATHPQTSYKVSLSNGFYGSLILDDASKSTAPLARASPEGRRGYDVLLPGSIVAEGLRRQSRKNKWTFAIPVGVHGEVETFEWRRSRGSEIKQLGASWRGWKLVRLGSSSRGQYDAAQDMYHEKDDESLPRYSSSEDEKHGRADSAHAIEESGEGEIVAVWAKTGCWTSLHDVGEFAFHGSGASGELGSRFAVMAVMTALCIWQKAMRDQATAGAVSATSTVVVT